ncbi:hypothetical protein IQ37_04775 [Chryseobacterium piperi]|uniref:Carrier domain-containing protein n=1 Tax=Chryseobacterium piperi TaxID=558152 RepID=A0A086BKS9_9FLAO|nr:condensation domain-containing protein [Chryseobacterium piperi]ASW74381.2 hypothetical protein CJF12_08820 [Chryseobacterium piperi]KFF29543.1 hypothetical protein IQ37_04775 [Chryseobacterium piperi]
MEIKTITSLLVQSTRLYPNKIAIQTEEGRLTYNELYKLSSEISNIILSLKDRKSPIVGVVAEPGVELVTALLGTWFSNSIYMPFDLHHSNVFLKKLLSDSNPSVIICNTKHIEKVQKLVKVNGIEIDLLIAVDLLESKIISYQPGNCNPVLKEIETGKPFPEACDEAYLFYTSGTTGEPKGVLGSRSSLNHFINWEIKEFGIHEDFRVSQLTSPTFDASLRDILVPLCTGATLVIPSNKVRHNPALLIEWIIKNEITLIHCVPTMFRLIYSEFTDGMDELTQLKFVLLAGEPLYNKDVLAWRKYVKDCTLVNLYGTTETTLIKSFYRIGIVPTGGVTAISVGKPIEGCKIAVIKDNRICKIGEEGDIYIKTAHKSLGYYNNPEASYSVFVQNPLLSDTEDIIYYTGDKGKFDADFNLHIEGRKDERLKINGVLIEPKAIEKAILSLDNIKETVVIARENNNFEKELVAYYTSTQEEMTHDFHLLLIDLLNPNQIPVDFVHLEKFPLTQNGKIDRKQLAHLLVKTGSLSKNMSIPETENETFLKQVWSELLSKDKFGMEDSFFSIGGSSLKAIQLISRIYKEYQILLNIRDIFQYNSIRKLGEQITVQRNNSSHEEQDESIKPVKEKEDYPLSFGQQRVWLQHQMEEGRIPYNIVRTFVIEGELNVELLKTALLSVVKKQEGLRTVFIRNEEGIPRQKIIPFDQFTFNFQQYTIDAEDNNQNDIEPLLQSQELKLFDFENGPLFSILLIDDKMGKYVLSFSMHHIIGDYWSLGLFANELTRAYSSLLQNPNFDAGTLSLQYKDFSEWQYDDMDSIRFKKSMKYWENQLKDSPLQSTFQHDWQRPKVPLKTGNSIYVDIDPELSEDLILLAKNKGTTLYTLLLSLYFILLNKDSGQSDLVIGSPVAGRSRKELEPIIGFFLNTVAVRAKIQPESTITAIIEMVKTLAVEALANQEVPFDTIVNHLMIKRNIQYAPLFQCMLVFQNAPTGQFELKNTTIKDYPSSGKTSKNDLTFSFAEVDNKLQWAIEYSTELYDLSTIELLIMKFKKLMSYACENPDVSLEKLDLRPTIEENTDITELLNSELKF